MKYYDKSNAVLQGEFEIRALPDLVVEDFKWYPAANGNTAFATVKLSCEGEALVPKLDFFRGKRDSFRDPTSYMYQDELDNVTMGISAIECELDALDDLTEDAVRKQLEARLAEVNDHWSGHKFRFTYEGSVSSVSRAFSIESRGPEEIQVGDLLLNFPSFTVFFQDSDQDSYVSEVLKGENIHHRYYVTDDDNLEGLEDPLERESEAVSIAEQYGFKYVVKSWEVELFDGEVIIEDAETVWVNPNPSTEDHLDEGYGGAFDIEDDQYFTREDLNEFADQVMEHVDETFWNEFQIGGSWLDDGILTVNIQSIDGMEEYETSTAIDMRRVKGRKGLSQYALPMASELIR